MKNITYISASAGSGKTYTLTKTMAELVESGQADPSQMILTTFTIKAANEFKERAKKRLYDGGMYQQAAMLDNALIGTIHSVASQLIKRYWFMLGLSPNIDIMAEEESDVYRAQSMSRLATDLEVGRLRNFARQFNIVELNGYQPSKRINYNFWREPLSQIIAFTTNYGIEDYTLSRSESKRFFQGLVNNQLGALPNAQQINSVLMAVEKAVLNTKESKARTNRLEEIAEFKRQAKRPTVFFYSKLGAFIAKLPNNVRNQDVNIDLYTDVLCAVWQNGMVYELVSDFIDLMFDLAKRWRSQFSEYKRQHSLLDFNDLEKYLLQLLEHPVCAREIAAEFRYAFVDEFQDCSPLQVKIFDRLSELIDHSWWVGDAKQAIYGFRGSDTMLTDAIVNIIASGEADSCRLKTLDTSYRSVPEIVNACNDVFTQVFDGLLSPDKVCLKADRKSQPGGKPLTIWHTDGEETGLGGYISRLIADGAKPSDIAVLGRTSTGFENLCDELNDFDIPVNYANKPICDSKVLTLLTSLLSIADNEGNTLAKAQVAFLTQPGMDTEQLIQEVLDGSDVNGVCSYDFLNQVPLIRRLLDIRQRLNHQSVGALTQSLVLELNLYNEARVCANADEVDGVLTTVCDQAAVFEERNARLGLVPTVTGFVEFITAPDSGIMLPGNPDGVRIMTMHGAKGLQWKHVIVSSLASDPSDEQKCIKRDLFGTHYRRTAQPTAQNLYPEIYISLLPFIFNQGNVFGNGKVPAPLDAMIANGQDFASARENKVQEEARLMYVAMTRAADQLILHVDERKSAPLAWFTAIGVPEEYCAVETLCQLHGFVNEDIDYDEDDEVENCEADRPLYRYPMPAAAVSHLQRDHAPSQQQGSAVVADRYETGARIPVGKLTGGKDESHLGNCIHQIFRMHEHGRPELDEISTVISRHDLSVTLPDVRSIAQAWDNLLDQLAKRHGGVISHSHERSFVMRQQGRVYTGSIDLTVETGHGTVLVDYKCCPMNVEQIMKPNSPHYPGLYGGQLKCYADALTAAGSAPVATYLYYPVAGLLAQL